MIYRYLLRMGWAFNRTILELKFLASPPPQVLPELLIVPYWN